MVDFNALRNSGKSKNTIHPVDLFRRLPKPDGINDLYTSQAEVLNAWFDNRTQKDIVVKLHTGGGKTLVGLLIAQSSLNETKEPAVYLVPNNQLVKQTIEKARESGISAVAYEQKRPLPVDFVNSKSILVASYKALFHGRSKFGISGAGHPQKIGSIILDDAHVAFSIIRDSFTISVEPDEDEIYKSLCGLFANAFKKIEKSGTYEDVVSGKDFSILEVPYWAWNEKIDVIRTLLKDKFGDTLEWQLVRDNLRYCHGLISKESFTITPIVPFPKMFPSFSDCSRRIYMSATISDDSELIKTFGANPEFVSKPLKSKSLAGISERMILTPDLMKLEFNQSEHIAQLTGWTKEQKKGSVVLVPSDESGKKWSKIGRFAKGSAEVEEQVSMLQANETYGPIIFSNRYDGIDLPGNSCRLLVLIGLPVSSGIYEMFRANALYGSDSVTRLIAQRIEQGIGRGSRGSSDHCVVILTGKDISSWISKEGNYKFLTTPTKAQIEIGVSVSKSICDYDELIETIEKSFQRDRSWIKFHAEALAEAMDDPMENLQDLNIYEIERKAIDLWHEGYAEDALKRIDKFLSGKSGIDKQSKGWIQQIAARIADSMDRKDVAEAYQRDAYSNNRNLLRPNIMPTYIPIAACDEQAKRIANSVSEFRLRRGLISEFEECASFLNSTSSANQFEQNLAEIGRILGFHAERHDINGEGPDVLWIMPNNTAWIIEAKSRKYEGNPLTKDQHGQLLVASEWFKKHYPNHSFCRVSVHPHHIATKAAVAGASHALTYEKLTLLISNCRTMVSEISESKHKDENLQRLCAESLKRNGLRYTEMESKYLIAFSEGASEQSQRRK